MYNLENVKLFTISEIANILRINRSSVSRLLKSKQLSYIRIGGRKVVSEEDLTMFIDNNRVATDENTHCKRS